MIGPVQSRCHEGNPIEKLKIKNAETKRSYDDELATGTTDCSGLCTAVFDVKIIPSPALRTGE